MKLRDIANLITYEDNETIMKMMEMIWYVE